MQVQMVVLDMAGTTVYDGDAVHSRLQSALSAAGITVTRDAVNRVMGIAKPLAIRTLLEECDPEQREFPAREISEARVDAIHTAFLARMLGYYRSDPGVHEIAGASQTFQALRSAGVKVALDTGFSRPIADAILERLGWQQAGLLDATVTSDEVVHGRPYPDLIFRAMELTGITEVSCVAKVGDTPSDLQEGQAAGCGWIIGVTGGSHTRSELAPYPHTHLISTIADLFSCLS